MSLTFLLRPNTFNLHYQWVGGVLWQTRGGFRIPRRRTLQEAPTNDFAKFSTKKLHEIEKILGRGGGGAPDPPMQTKKYWEWRNGEKLSSCTQTKIFVAPNPVATKCSHRLPSSSRSTSGSISMWNWSSWVNRSGNVRAILEIRILGSASCASSSMMVCKYWFVSLDFLKR